MHKGSCHCGAVRLTIPSTPDVATKCNCSLCTKARSWFALAPPDHVRLLAGADAQSLYEWVPPGKPESFLHFRFCKTCGVRTFGVGGDNAFCFVNVAALDNVDRDELERAPLRIADGKNDRFEVPPTDTRFL